MQHLAISYGENSARVIGCRRLPSVFAAESSAKNYSHKPFKISVHGFPQHIEVLSAVGALNQLPMHLQTGHFSSSARKLPSVYLQPR